MSFQRYSSAVISPRISVSCSSVKGTFPPPRSRGISMKRGFVRALLSRGQELCGHSSTLVSRCCRSLRVRRKYSLKLNQLGVCPRYAALGWTYPSIRPGSLENLRSPERPPYRGFSFSKSKIKPGRLARGHVGPFLLPPIMRPFFLPFAGRFFERLINVSDNHAHGFEPR